MKHFAGLVSMKRWLTTSSLFLCLLVGAQDIPIGTWRTHFSYTSARILEKTSDKLFCAGVNGFFSYELASGSIRKLSKIDGLSDVGVLSMAYSLESNSLVIGYGSGLVDIVQEKGITTITTIATSSLEGEKAINAIATANGLAYLASDLGIVVVRLSDGTILENYIQIGAGGGRLEIDEIIVANDALILATNEGVQLGNLNENLLDFNNWTRFEGAQSFSNLVAVGNQSFALNADEVFALVGSSWQSTGTNLPAGATNLFGQNNTLFTVTTERIYRFDENRFESVAEVDATVVNDLIEVEGMFFLADEEQGLLDSQGNGVSPEGPVADSYSRVSVLDNQVYGFHAPSPFVYDGTQKVGAYSLFSEGRWRAQSIEGFENVTDVARFAGTTYFSSLGDGLYSEGNIRDIPSSSAALDTMFTSLIAGQHLWVSGFGAEPLHQLDLEGNWTSFRDDQLFSSEILDVSLSRTGIAWLGTANNITVFDFGRDLVDQLSRSDGLPDDYTDFTISIEDNAWVATADGPGLFPDASFIFESASAILPTFENRVLFGDEEINSIVTDGGNRVWFGTNRGLWVFDENISEQIALFDESNSPLPSNQVLDFAYNPLNGEIFIVTTKGMVSYRSASSIGSSSHQKVSFFPNPVRPSYQGLVGISGLANNVSLKITDINGNLVKEVDANGGSASWDLLDLRGSPVVTGIYYFFSSTADGEETFVGKVAVVR